MTAVSSTVSPCQRYLVSLSPRNKSNMSCLSQLFLQLLPSTGSSSVPLMHRSEHKLFHTSIPSASHFCCCQHVDHPKTNKPKNASGCFVNITVYLYYSQKSTLHQDAFQKVEEFSPRQNWHSQSKRNSIRRLAGKSGCWRLDLLSNQDITSLFQTVVLVIVAALTSNPHIWKWAERL